VAGPSKTGTCHLGGIRQAHSVSGTAACSDHEVFKAGIMSSEVCIEVLTVAFGQCEH